MATLLTCGLIALLLELPDWWSPIMEAGDGRGVAGIWGVMIIMWSVWATIFFIYWRQGDRYTQSGKMIRALVSGSLLATFVTVPVHIWAADQREYYCFRGTYTTLVLAGTVLFWAFGPGIVLLYMRERYRRVKLLHLCANCGYDLRGTLAAGRHEFPECGAKVIGATP